jgi:hypothetical protein
MEIQKKNLFFYHPINIYGINKKRFYILLQQLTNFIKLKLMYKVLSNKPLFANNMNIYQIIF